MIVKVYYKNRAGEIIENIYKKVISIVTTKDSYTIVWGSLETVSATYHKDSVICIKEVNE